VPHEFDAPCDRETENSVANLQNVVGQTLGVQEGAYRLLPVKRSPSGWLALVCMAIMRPPRCVAGPFDPYMIQGAVAFAVAAKAARLEHIVGLTQWLASPSHPSLMTRQLWLVDRLFSMTPGVAHTIVRPGIFADGVVLWPPGLAWRLVFGSTGCGGSRVSHRGSRWPAACSRWLRC
jgi:hypothetical protein